MSEDSKNSTGPHEVISLDQFRSRKNEEKKRKTERIFFNQLMGVYSVIKPGKMVPIELIDVSETGLGIQVPFNSEKVWPTETERVPVRLYFSPDSFMEIEIDVKNSRPTIDGGVRYVRYGCAVRSDHRAFEAWTQFVNFLKCYSDISERDNSL